MKIRPIDLTTLAQTTGVQFESDELVEMAASCLDEITKEMEKEESKDSTAATASLSSDVSQKEKDTSQQENSDVVETSAKEQTSCDQSNMTDVAAQQPTSNKEEMDKQHQDADASKEKASPEDSGEPAQGQSKMWVVHVISAGHSILWPQSMTPSIGPTLLTGVRLGEEDRLVDDLMEWERKLENERKWFPGQSSQLLLVKDYCVDSALR